MKEQRLDPPEYHERPEREYNADTTDRFDGKAIAMKKGGGWGWMTKEEAMPNPAGGYWIERPTLEEQAQRDCEAAMRSLKNMNTMLDSIFNPGGKE